MQPCRPCACLGDEGQKGISCVKFANISFGNSSDESANKAYDGGRALFMNVSDGEHPILFGQTSATKLCFEETNICKQFESTVFYMCIQIYQVSQGDCNINASAVIEDARTNELGNWGLNWTTRIADFSMAGDSIEMGPGSSEMYQVFGWDVYANRLLPNEWGIGLKTVSSTDGEDAVIDLTESIESPVFDSWLFPLFTSAATVGDSGTGIIYDANGVAPQITIDVTIVNCTNGFEYTELTNTSVAGFNANDTPIVFTCVSCPAGTYTMTTHPCRACPVTGMDCMGEDDVIIDKFWCGGPESDGMLYVVRWLP